WSGTGGWSVGSALCLSRKYVGEGGGIQVGKDWGVGGMGGREGSRGCDGDATGIAPPEQSASAGIVVDGKPAHLLLAVLEAPEAARRSALPASPRQARTSA